MDNAKISGVNNDNGSACHPLSYERGLLGGGVKKHFVGEPRSPEQKSGVVHRCDIQEDIRQKWRI